MGAAVLLLRTSHFYTKDPSSLSGYSHAGECGEAERTIRVQWHVIEH